MTETAIWWVRRDLRLRDNAALALASTGARQVVPLFVLDPALLESQYASPKRTAFLFGGLRALDADLRARGRPGGPATRWWMPPCANWRRPAGCTTGRA